MMLIKASESTAARRRIPLYLVDDTDGKTPETSVTFSAGDIKVSKNGASEANHAGTVTELADGSYYYEFTSGEVDTVGFINARFVKSGVRTFVAVAQVVAFDPYDSVRMGQTALPNATAGSSNGLWILGSMTGSPAITGSFSIANASGSAMTLLSAGSNGAGLTLAGNGSGAGLSATGGATGAGFAGIGGATSGHAMSLIATAGNSYGLLAQGAGAGAAHGAYFDGNGTGVDLKLAADDPLPANVTKWSGTAVATPDTAGYPKVTIKSGTGTGELSITSGVVGADAVQISGDATAANNLEAMLDGTGGITLSIGKINIVDLSGLGATISVITPHDAASIAIQSAVTGSTGVVNIYNSSGTGAGLHIYGGLYSVRLDTLGDGIWIDNVSGYACIRLVPVGSGSAVSLDAGVGFTGPMIQGTIDFQNPLVSAINAGSLASDTITAAKIAADAITAAKIATGAIDADALATDAVNEIADGYLNRTDGIETGVTPKQAMQRIGATTAGKVSGAATTTNTFLGLDGSTTRVTATVDTDGNRSAITYA